MGDFHEEYQRRLTSAATLPPGLAVIDASHGLPYSTGMGLAAIQTFFAAVVVLYVELHIKDINLLWGK